MKKTAARSYGLAQRKKLSEEERKRYSHLIAQKAIGLLRHADIVGCYAATACEVMTCEIIDYCLAHGITLALPKVTGSTLAFFAIESLADLEKGSFGILEPMRGQSVDVRDISLMFVPLSSFDESGHRTGYGKGYYDSVLNDCRNRIGLSFECQKVENIETDRRDVDLDGVITEKENYGRF